MRKIPNKTFFMLDINGLEDIVKEEYDVELIVLKGYPSGTINSDAIHFHNHESAIKDFDSSRAKEFLFGEEAEEITFNEYNIPLAKAFLHDGGKEVPDALSIIACLIEEKVLPQGNYMMDLRW